MNQCGCANGIWYLTFGYTKGKYYEVVILIIVPNPESLFIHKDSK